MFNMPKSQLQFGVAPYNPTLGETQRKPYCLTPAGFTPPSGICPLWHRNDMVPLSGFKLQCKTEYGGTSIETKVHGKRQLKLHNHGETYEMNSPDLVIRMLPIPGTDWVGNLSLDLGQVED
ncbi:unnamed protein product [Sphenostylis stenocarpa]|uniref:Uncharacterized protein n=1 Tax=Sphenostylis stenocarpa TaxID=92480 RepID=A0AA86VXN2_9FABA|nr:unnamed protein product [Sphenostylis stenocarpa]